MARLRFCSMLDALPAPCLSRVVRRRSRITTMAEMTCPKCGKQYYGIGCPYCDYPPVPPDKRAARTSLLMGFILLAVGISIAAGFIFDKSWHRLTVLATGVAFALGGLQLVGVQLLYNEKGRVSTLVGGLILAAFSYLCLDGAFSRDALWGGGIPFIPQSWNQMLCRTMSGLFGVTCAAFSLRCFYLVVKPKHKNDRAA